MPPPMSLQFGETGECSLWRSDLVGVWAQQGPLRDPTACSAVSKS